MGHDRDVSISERERQSAREKRRRGDDSLSASESAEEDRRGRRERRPRSRQQSEESDQAEQTRSHRKRSSHQRSRSRSPYRGDKHRRRQRDRKNDDRSRHHRLSSSPPSKRRRHSRDDAEARDVKPPAPHQWSRAPLPSQNDAFKGTQAITEGDGPPPDKQKPNFKPTGLLAKEANTVAGTTTVLKYHEPPEARKPPTKEAWRMYVFKGKDLVDTIYLHQRSAWLVGRDQKVTDYLLEHPSISKQHAVVQFRHITSTNEYGDKTSKVKPYLIDLESANGTRMNGKPLEASRFVELVDGDVVHFGESEREYVLMLPPS